MTPPVGRSGPQRPRPRTVPEIESIDRASRAVRDVIREVANAVTPGVSLEVLSRIAGDVIARAGAQTRWARSGSPVGWGINSVPRPDCSPSGVVQHGSFLCIDAALRLDGHWGDGAEVVPVGAVDGPTADFLASSRAGLKALIAACTPGRLWSAITDEWRSTLAPIGLHLEPGWAGHGIGPELHESPRAPYCGFGGGPVDPQDDFTIRPGLVLAVEPVFRSDGGAFSASLERVVLIEPRGPRILGDFPV